MDIMSVAQLLGNFGEFFGAIAVVITLAFVGIQLRRSRFAMIENNTFARIASLDESRRAFSDWRCRFAENPNLTTLWLSGLAGANLEGTEKYRFRALQEERQFLLGTAYDRYIAHDMPERAKAMAGGLAILIEQNPLMPKLNWGIPGTEAFQREVDAQLAQLGNAGGDTK